MKYIFLLIFILFYLTCTTSTESIKKREDVRLFPLTVGTTWVYNETYISDDTTYSKEYSVQVRSVENIARYDWYEIMYSYGRYDIIRYFMCESDSVYELQYNYGTPVRALQYFIPTKNREEFTSLLGGDVVITKTVSRLDTTLSTPAGNFSACYLFTYSTPDWTEKEYLTVGVGIIQREFIHHPISGKQTFTRIAILKSYSVKETH